MLRAPNDQQLRLAPHRLPAPLGAAGRLLAAVAGAAFLAGTMVGARHEPSERRVAERFAGAWERGDYAAMHALLSDAARRRTSLARFTAAYRRAAVTATATAVRAGQPGRGAAHYPPNPCR